MPSRAPTGLAPPNLERHNTPGHAPTSHAVPGLERHDLPCQAWPSLAAPRTPHLDPPSHALTRPDPPRRALTRPERHVSPRLVTTCHAAPGPAMPRLERHVSASLASSRLALPRTLGILRFVSVNVKPLATISVDFLGDQDLIVASCSLTCSTISPTLASTWAFLVSA